MYQLMALQLCWKVSKPKCTTGGLKSVDTLSLFCHRYVELKKLSGRGRILSPVMSA